MNNLPETAHGTLSLLFNSKSQNESMALRLITEIEEGRVDALKVHIYLKSIDNLLNQLFDKKTNADLSARYNKLVQSEADKYPEKTFSLHGATVQKKGGRAYYDYSGCNDPELAKYEREINALQELMLERQEFLKTVPKAGIDILKDDEVITIYPPVKNQSDTISITLPK